MTIQEETTRRIITAGFGLMLLLLIVVTVIAVRNSVAMGDRLNVIVNVRNLQSDRLADLRNIARERSLALYHMALTRDPFEVDAMKIRMSLLAGKFLEARETLRALPVPQTERDALEALFAQAVDSTRAQRGVIALLELGHYDEANALLIDEAIPIQDRLLSGYDRLVAEQREKSRAVAVEAQQASHAALTLIISGGAAIVFLGVLVSIRVTRKTVAAERALRQLNAELESRVEARTRELSQSNEDLEHTVETLKAAQGHLVQSEKMASLGALVAGISHEVNTPIGVSLTAASHLQDEAHDLREAYHGKTMKRSELEAFLERTQESTGILVQNLRRAAELIGSFKRVAVDQASDDWQSIILRDYVDEVLRSLAPSMKNKPITVENACDPNVILQTNPGAISQIISNLVMNALVHAFGDDSGHIYIAAHYRDGDVEIVFDDDGRGMDADIARRVFDPFFTTRRASGGSGLGLHIVFNLVTNTLRGNIEVRSQPGEGTTFVLTLPREQEVMTA